MSVNRRRTLRSTFLIKGVLAIPLVGLADWLFYGHWAGATLGAFALALTLAALIAHPAARRDRRALAAVCIAASLAILQIETPSLLGWTLFWSALMIAVLSPRAGRRQDAWQWFQRLILVPFAGLVDPVLDVLRLGRRKERLPRLPPLAILSTAALPLIGGVIFLGLFAVANPVIANGLAQIVIPPLDGLRASFWVFIFIAVWSVLRPRYLRRPKAIIENAGGHVPGVSVISVTLSLLVFNAVFALQNGLDLAFLWSGASLPTGMTLAGYAHRGAFTLIASALLAGLFVLVALRPGSASARQPLIRFLVILWVAQNVFLVASSILRTLDYIEVYSLTRLRIAALAWMGLVAIGLMLICWRLLRAKSSAWLVNANVLSAGVVLVASCVVDLGAVAANWNIAHAREMGGPGAALDVCYLENLGDSGVVSLAELEQRPLPRSLLARVTRVRAERQADLDRRQADWHTWTARGMRRLERLHQLPGHQLDPAIDASCFDETSLKPAARSPPPAAVAALPQPGRLTSSAGR